MSEELAPPAAASLEVPRTEGERRALLDQIEVLLARGDHQRVRRDHLARLQGDEAWPEPELEARRQLLLARQRPDPVAWAMLIGVAMTLLILAWAVSTT